MRKLFILVVAFTTILSFGALAQNTVSIGATQGPVGNQVSVPVTATFTDVGGFDFYIDYDNVNTTFVGIINQAANVSATAVLIGNQIYVNRLGTPSLTVTNIKLFDLVFTSNTVGLYDLEFYQSGNYGDAGTTFVGSGTPPNIVPVTATFNDGTVEFFAYTAPVPLKNWALFIGLGLIIAFVVVRFRRLI